MRNTYTKLSAKEQSTPDIEVLLATFNGARYLKEFLDSLTRQEGVKIHLRVSDDASTDETLEIVKSYQDKFESCLTFQGPCEGPSSNFFSLIDRATFDFIALADQDDVWYPYHLSNSIDRLEKSVDPLSMTFCQVIETNESSSDYEKVWPNISSSPELHEIFFQNFARGCTMVLKRELAELISRNPRSKAVMHDWWIYLVAKSCGSTIFSVDPEVRYRIHGKNTIGHGPKFRKRISNFFFNSIRGKWAPWDQLEQLEYEFQDVLLPEAKSDLFWLFNIPNLRFKNKFHQIFLDGRKLRTSFISDTFVKFYLLLRS
jgi:glycosyltransferase involved in cell wall biosynthesis